MTMHQAAGFDVRVWRSPAARWAVVYLAAAGALIAVAGSEFSGPSPRARARTAVDRAAAELDALLGTASGVADAHAASRRTLEREQRADLEAALAVAVRWVERSAPADGGPDGDFAGAAGELAGVLPDELALSVLGPDGQPLFEAGGSARPESACALSETVRGGLTVVVERVVPPEDVVASARQALDVALAPGVRFGTGLCVLTGREGAAVEVAPRPVPGAALPAALAAGAPAGPAVEVTGDLETGQLVTVRRANDPTGWTLVAERFLPPEVLAEGDRGVAGMIALSGLGLLAAAAFAHALRAGLAASADAPDTAAGAPARATRPVATGVAPQRARQAPAATGEPEAVSTGNSILRLREAYGESPEGPDLAAGARSPILRALSHHLRSGQVGRLPREVREWSKAS